MVGLKGFKREGRNSIQLIKKLKYSISILFNSFRNSRERRNFLGEP
jgi:hypothetical protein